MVEEVEGARVDGDLDRIAFANAAIRAETPDHVPRAGTPYAKHHMFWSGGHHPQRQLPNGGAVLSDLSLGCAQLGNLYREVSDAEAQATVASAWELGVRYFDTAPHYGLGLSERRLGAALASLPRDAYVISSKVGRLLEPTRNPRGLDDDGYIVPATHRRVWDFSRDGIRRSLTESLEQLGLDRVDIVYLHDPDKHWAQVLETGYPTLAELRDQGVVKAIGAGMNQASNSGGTSSVRRMSTW